MKTRVEQERHDTDDYDLHDTINEIADSFVPVYTREILEVALSNFNLVCEESQL